jgi:hypothetical protein
LVLGLGINEELNNSIQRKQQRLSGFSTLSVGTAPFNALLKERWEGWEDEEEDVSSHWMKT